MTKNRCEGCGKASGKYRLCRKCAESEIEYIQEAYAVRGSCTYTEAQAQIAQVAAAAGLPARRYRP